MMGFIIFIFCFIATLFILLFIYLKLSFIKYDKEERILKDPNVPDNIKMEIRHERYLKNQKHKESIQKSQVIRMSQSCKFENVYGTYKDANSDSKKLTLYDNYMSYETNSGVSCFAMSYDSIIDAKCDTTENLTAMRFIALGVLAFAFKKKTHYTVITYKDDLTNSDQQLIFRVDNPSNKDEFINNLLIKRNQYLLNKKQPI